MKVNVPIIILERLQPILDRNLEFIYHIEDETLFHLADKQKSELNFKLIKYSQFRDLFKSGYFIEYRPIGRDNMQSTKYWCHITDVEKQLKSWIEDVGYFNRLYTVFDDPIVKQYEDSFFKEFDVHEENSDYAPFDLNRQIFLDDYLKATIFRLENLKVGKPEKEQSEIDSLMNEAEQIRKVITKESQKKIIKRLARFWAKAQKIGIYLIKEIFVNVSAEITKRLILGEK